MRAFIVRILNLAVLLLTMILFAREPSIGLLVPVIVLVAALVEQERRISFGQLRQVDKDLFDKFLVELSANSDGIQFLKNHPMGTTFFLDELKPLTRFERCWTAPDHQFINRRVEMKRCLFHEALQAFLRELAHHIELETRGDRYRFFGKDNYAEFESTKQKLNTLASSAYEAYSDMVKTGKKMM